MEQYEEHIRTIQSDLNTARNAQTQISTIREALAKEKEIDILAIKKEVLQQKERQLQALRTEMQQDKEAAQKRMREDLEHREQLAAEVQRRLQEDLDRALAQAEELRAKIKPEVSTRTVDQQTDMCGDQVVARSEYDHVVLERDAARSDRDESHGREYDLCMEKEKIQFDCHNFAERCAAMECELKEKDAAIEALRQTLASQLEKSTTGKSQTTVPLSDVEKVKAQCTEAYETAVQQLQQKYSQLEERLAAKHQSDLIRQRREIELKLRDELDLVEDQRARAAALETQLADAAKLHRKELRALESKLTGQHADAVRKVKDQYLETLRQMRDDVAASKQRSLERVRAEWERKKTDLDEAWKKRYILAEIVGVQLT